MDSVEDALGFVSDRLRVRREEPDTRLPASEKTSDEDIGHAESLPGEQVTLSVVEGARKQFKHPGDATRVGLGGPEWA
jgi:hypothetical protein